MKSSRLSLKQNFSTLVWITKLAFSFNRINYVLLGISTIIQDNIPIATSFLAALIIEKLANGVRTFNDEIITLLVLIFLTGFISNYINSFNRYLTVRFNQAWELRAWNVFLNKTSSLDFQHLESPEYSLLMHKVKETVNWRGSIVAQIVPEAISGFIGIILIAGIFISINPIFIILILIPEIFRFVINKKYGFDLFSIWDSHGETKHHAWHAQDSLEKTDVLREAKIYSFTVSILSRYKSEVGKFMSESLKKLNQRYALIGIVTFFDVMILVSIQIWLILQVFAQIINIGSYTFYLGSITTASDAFNRLQISLSSLLEQLPFVDDFRKYLEMEDLVIKPENPVKILQTAPRIEFQNVSFKYPNSEEYVLKDVSFTIEPGEKIALVGENGAGKTTLIKLLARFYDVSDGEILVNDINIREIDLASYYKLWGVLFQSFAKLWFSIRENIGIGNTEDINNMELIKDAARKADAEEFINKLPIKYETLLSKDFKNGTDLSGGQWQKLGIARAMFANPKLIVLDEPTSALDALAEAEVFESINELSKNSTVLVISHRFATVRNANRILVLKDGKLLEQGTHKELLENDNLYAQMFNEQAKGYL
ncbi:MAG: ABC transporter ATP-binding protein [Candidatus Dojkabacteria bacterium]